MVIILACSLFRYLDLLYDLKNSCRSIYWLSQQEKLSESLEWASLWFLVFSCKNMSISMKGRGKNIKCQLLFGLMSLNNYEMLVTFICNLELYIFSIELVFTHILEWVYGGIAHFASCPNISMTIVSRIHILVSWA